MVDPCRQRTTHAGRRETVDESGEQPNGLETEFGLRRPGQPKRQREGKRRKGESNTLHHFPTANATTPGAAAAATEAVRLQ